MEMEMEETGRDNYVVMRDSSADGLTYHTADNDLAKEIHAHLKVLKGALPPVSEEGLTPSSTLLDGWLWVQKNEGRWKKRWFVWRYSDMHEQWNLYAYKSPDHAANRFEKAAAVQAKVKSILKNHSDDPVAKRMIKLTFAHSEEFSKKQQESFLEAMQKEDVPTSKSCIRVFSRKSIFLLGAVDDDEVARWDGVLTRYLKDLLGSRYSECLATAEKLAVLLKQQYAEYLRKCQELMKALEKNGFFEDKINQKRDKSGTLWVESQHEPDGWRKHRFILQGKVLFHYPSEKGHVAKRAIPLKYATIEYDTEQPEDCAIFHINTPLISYVIKAKHRIAMEEWVNAIVRNKLKPKRSAGAKITDGMKGVAAALSNFQLGGKPEEICPDAAPLLLGESDTSVDTSTGISAKRAMLVVTLPESKKEKTYTIKKSSYKIGRSSTNDISVDDARLSREHAVIDVVGDKLVFADLGSKRGSKVNRQRVSGRVTLQVGDTIKVGKTHIQVLLR